MGYYCGARLGASELALAKWDERDAEGKEQSQHRNSRCENRRDYGKRHGPKSYSGYPQIEDEYGSAVSMTQGQEAVVDVRFVRRERRTPLREAANNRPDKVQDWNKYSSGHDDER